MVLSIKQSFRGIIIPYRQHPELMLPFLAQTALSVLFSWVFLFLDDPSNPTLATIEVSLVLVVALANLMLQGWAFCLSSDALSGPIHYWETLRFVGRRLLRMLAVVLLIALPGSVLIVVFQMLTSDVIFAVGLHLSIALISWLTLFGFAVALVSDQPAITAVKEAVLLLGVRSLPVIGLFVVVLLQGVLNNFFSGSNVLVGVASIEAGPWGIGATVAWTVFSVLWLPLLYLWIVQFYQRHQTIPEQEVSE